jgi:hypothetical protein
MDYPGQPIAQNPKVEAAYHLAVVQNDACNGKDGGYGSEEFYHISVPSLLSLFSAYTKRPQNLWRGCPSARPDGLFHGALSAWTFGRVIHDNFRMRLVRAISIKAQHDIAVETETTILVFGESLLFDVGVYLAPLATPCSMLRPVAPDMVYRQKLDMRFAATHTLAAIGGHKFLLQTPVCFLFLGENNSAMLLVISTRPYSYAFCVFEII